MWALGFVSLFMDMSSELIHSLLPLFMASVLGASMTTIGAIEGIAEGTAAVTKVFAGAVSDYFRKRKILAVLGYALAALTKPLFPLARTIWWVFVARFMDRIGKGIRGAPRDALVADLIPAQLRGAAYGLRQALDSVGAFLGPVLAILFMTWLANDIRAVLWVAVLPAWLAVMLLILAVREPEHVSRGPAERPPLFAGARNLSRRYWLVVGLGIVLALARFSEAFLILRAKDVGLSVRYVPAVMVVMNVFYSLFAYPAGAAADRVAPRWLLLLGLGVLIGADLLLALAHSPGPVFLGTSLWGVHLALTQGLLSKLVADTAPVELRATAFGIFNLISGGALFLASIIAGTLWNYWGAPTPFMAGAGFAGIGALGLLFYRPGVTGIREVKGK